MCSKKNEIKVNNSTTPRTTMHICLPIYSYSMRSQHNTSTHYDTLEKAELPWVGPEQIKHFCLCREPSLPILCQSMH